MPQVSYVEAILLGGLTAHLVAADAGTGANTVTLTLLDTAANVVAGAQVSLRDTTDAFRVATANTDSLGRAIFQLDDGSYKVHVATSPLYETLAVQALSVIGDTAESYTLTPLAFTPPAAAGLCTVRVYVTLNGRPQAGYLFTAELVEQNSATASELFSLATDRATTDADGLAELQLVRLDQFTSGTGKYRLTVKDPSGKTASSKIATIPNADSAEYESLL